MLPPDHPLRCSEGDCPRQRRVVVPRPLCSKHLSALLRSTPEDMNLILPEDGVFDQVAVDILVNGFRPTAIRATAREYLAATKEILSHDPERPVEVVQSRFHVSWLLAWRLIQTARGQGILPPSPHVHIVSTTN